MAEKSSGKNVSGTDGDYDPFKDRKNQPNSMTDFETLAHLLKAAVGSGILSMPLAFKYSGLFLGVIGTLITALICTHCGYVLIKCTHVLCERTKQSAMTFSEVAEQSCTNGPEWGRRYGVVNKYIVILSLFATYFGTCSVYTVIIAMNIKQVLDFHTNGDFSLRLLMICLLLPLIFLTWVPHLKHLAPFSMIAIGFMALGISITLYYLTHELPPISERVYFGHVTLVPPFIAITIFAMEAIGIYLPLENRMKTPRNFLGSCGVLIRGMTIVTIVYTLLGFFGYWSYGDDTEASITLNLPIGDTLAQAVKLLVASAVFLTFGLQMFVCIEITWNILKDSIITRPNLKHYIMRTILTVSSVLLAVAVPSIGPFVGLMGAVSFTILGLFAPVFIETVTFWDDGFGKYNWIIVKNIFVIIFALIAMIFGTVDAVKQIIELYS